MSDIHGFEAAWDAFQNCPIDGALDDEDNMRSALKAALAIGKDATEENLWEFWNEKARTVTAKCMAQEALIRELVATLADARYALYGHGPGNPKIDAALDRAKAQGFEP